MRLAILATVASLTACVAGAAQGSARIEGTARDGQGRPVAGLTMIVVAAAAPPADQGPAEGRFPVTDDQGRFAADNLPAGTYRVCTDSWSLRLLNPCEWGSEKAVTVAEGEVKQLGVLSLATASVIRVQILDPQGVKPTMASGDWSVYARPVAFTPEGNPHFSRITLSQGGVHQFEMLAPPDADLTVGIDAANIVVADSQGAAVTRANRYPVRAGAAPMLTFTMRPR